MGRGLVFLEEEYCAVSERGFVPLEVGLCAAGGKGGGGGALCADPDLPARH